ncbi:MAG: uroporphyrinogen-III synthase [Rhodobacteraceae bacterium]|nr:MAG: uroporphyrinogen-III synthase [Paracoccaceae bacterium]
MRDDRPLVLLTRPRAASEAFAASLGAALGDRVRIVISALMEIVPQDVTLALEDVKGLIFTSRNGVEAAQALTSRRDLPAYCVGSATTDAASRAGWRARMMGPDAAALVAGMRALRPDAPLLHLHGRHARGDIAGLLVADGIEVREEIVYDQVERALSPEALTALRGDAPVILPLFSPRSARLFAAAFDGHVHAIAAISQAVADALPRRVADRILIADEPTAEAMVAAVEKLAAAPCAG